MIFIISRDKKTAEYIANNKRLHPNQWQYVGLETDGRQLRATRGAKVWCYGGYNHRRDWHELKEIMIVTNARVEYPTDEEV